MVNITPKDVFLKEMLRKSIHLASFSFPLIYHFYGKNFLLLLVSIFVIFMTIIEYSRFFKVNLYQSIRIHILNFSKIDIAKTLRAHEDNNLTGASYMAISMLICIIFFSKFLVVTAFSILAISDTLAALIGIKFGKIKLLDKTLEGSLAFFISATFICFFTAKLYNITSISTFALIFICLFTTLMEFFSKNLQLDDNLSIPLMFCILGSLC